MKGKVSVSVGLGLFLLASSGCCSHKHRQCVDTQVVRRQVVQEQRVQHQTVENSTVVKETVVERVVVKEVPPPVPSQRTVVVIQSPPPVDWSALVSETSGASADVQIAMIEKIVATGKSWGYSNQLIAYALAACRQVCKFDPSYEKVNCDAAGLSQAVGWRRADLKQKYGLWARNILELNYQVSCLLHMANDSYKGGCLEQISQSYGYYHYPSPRTAVDRKKWREFYSQGSEVHVYYTIALRILNGA